MKSDKFPQVGAEDYKFENEKIRGLRVTKKC